MSLIDILIKKVDELTKSINFIKSSSKTIYELPTISGEDIYVAATNGKETGKFLISNYSESEPRNYSSPWYNIDLSPASNFFLDDQNSSYNFIVENDLWSITTPLIRGFYEGTPSDGLVGYLRNGHKEPIILKHNLINDSAVRIPFFLSSGLDYQMNPNEILSFKYSKERNQCEVSVYSSEALVPLKAMTEVYQLSESDLSQPNITIKLKEAPSKSDFTNVYVNGVFINPHDLITTDNILIIAKSNIDYPIKSGMKVTINYKF